MKAMHRDELHQSIRRESLALLISHIRDKSNPIEATFPWRKGWEHTLHHSLRVEACAEEILGDAHGITPAERYLVSAACLVHDIGKLDVRSGHARKGAEIISEYIAAGRLPLVSEGIDLSRLLMIVENHS